MDQEALFLRFQGNLRSHRLRVTLPRIEVFGALYRAHGRPLDREALIHAVQCASPGVGISAINQAVRDLDKAGLVSIDNSQGRLSLFRLRPLLSGPGRAAARAEPDYADRRPQDRAGAGAGPAARPGAWAAAWRP